MERKENRRDGTTRCEYWFAFILEGSSISLRYAIIYREKQQFAIPPYLR